MDIIRISVHKAHIQQPVLYPQKQIKTSTTHKAANYSSPSSSTAPPAASTEPPSPSTPVPSSPGPHRGFEWALWGPGRRRGSGRASASMRRGFLLVGRLDIQEFRRLVSVS